MPALAHGEKCPSCGARQEYATNKRCHRCGMEFVEAAPQPAPPPAGAITYKVLTQRDDWFKAAFTPARLEEAINAHAAEGWRVVGVATTDVGSMTGSFTGHGRQEMIVFLEKRW